MKGTDLCSMYNRAKPRRHHSQKMICVEYTIHNNLHHVQQNREHYYTAGAIRNHGGTCRQRFERFSPLLRGSQRCGEVFTNAHPTPLLLWECAVCTNIRTRTQHTQQTQHSLTHSDDSLHILIAYIHYFGMILTSGWMCLMKSPAVHEPGLWVVLRHPCYHSCWRFQKRGGLLSVAPSLITDHAAVNQGPASPGPSRLMLAWRAFLSIRMTYSCSVIYAVRRDQSISDHLARNGVINVRQESHWAVKFTGHQKMGRVGGSGGDVCNK